MIPILHWPGVMIAGAVGADQPDIRLMGLEVGDGPDHVDDGDSFRDRDDDGDPGVGRFHDRIGRERRRHEDHGGVGAGLLDGLGAGVEDRDAERGRAPPARRDPPTRFVP